MMRNLTCLPVDDDLIDRILFFCPNFDTLQAFIQTCKAIHDVYQRYPKSIIRAVAYNVAGPALPQAMRLIRYKLKIDSEDERGALKTTFMVTPEPEEKLPLRNDEIRMLIDVAGTASRLENLFSQTRKNKASKLTKLSWEESWRFRRAMYHGMLYCAAFGLDRSFSGNDDENPYFNAPEDTGETIQALRHQRKSFLEDIAALELLELRTIGIFLKDLISHINVACNNYQNDPDFCEYALSLGPSILLECYEKHSMDPLYDRDWAYDDVNLEAVSGFLDEPLNSIFAERRVKIPDNEWKQILDEVIGETDQCRQCGLVLGMKLWGQANWDLLCGSISSSSFLGLVKGRLVYNPLYNGDIRGILCNSTYEFSRMLSEMFDLKTAEYATWNKDDWLCLSCFEKFFAAHFHLWFVEYKRIRGQPFPSENCWYGYNCRTQTHKPAHAARLNHFCEPTRGD